MSKIILSIILMIALQSQAFSADRSVGQSFRIPFNIVDASGASVTGQSPTVKIQKVSNGYFYDFSDSTFKTSGWTNKTTIMTEDSTNGVYYYTFTPPATETSQEQYLFIIDNVDATYTDHQMLLVNYDDIIGTVNRARGR